MTRVYHFVLVHRAKAAAAQERHAAVQFSAEHSSWTKAQVARAHVAGGRQASTHPEIVGVACEFFSQKRSRARIVTHQLGLGMSASFPLQDIKLWNHT